MAFHIESGREIEVAAPGGLRFHPLYVTESELALAVVHQPTGLYRTVWRVPLPAE